MKSTIKLTLIAATFAVAASGSALADNDQHRNMLAIQRAHSDQNGRMTTVAVYTNDRAVGYGYQTPAREEIRFETRTNAHGDNFLVAAPVR